MVPPNRSPTHPLNPPCGRLPLPAYGGIFDFTKRGGLGVS
jgi:hypothetical protein